MDRQKKSFFLVLSALVLLVVLQFSQLATTTKRHRVWADDPVSNIGSLHDNVHKSEWTIHKEPGDDTETRFGGDKSNASHVEPLNKSLNISSVSPAENNPAIAVEIASRSFPLQKADHSFAYVFLLAGCNPESPSYRGFLLNIMLATDFMIRTLQIQADVVVLIRMASGSNLDRLPANEEKWLEQVGAKIVYLPIGKRRETFHQQQMLKFHVLELIQYRRVLYMDADIVPLCNLDYLFHLSVNGTLRENVILAWTREPANGGFFVLEPYPTGFSDVQEIIRKQQDASRHLPPPQFDTRIGWGHEITGSDAWVTFRGRSSGKSWNFYAAWSDQGLLYYYVKYFRRSVTLVQSRHVENWGPSNETWVQRLEDLENPFASHSCPQRKYLLKALGLSKTALYGDYAHYYAGFKPWLEPLDSLLLQFQRKGKPKTRFEFWFFRLNDTVKKFEMNDIPLNDARQWYSFLGMPNGTDSRETVNRVMSLKEMAKSKHSLKDLIL